MSIPAGSILLLATFCALLAATGMSCSKNQDNDEKGVLGIEVPVGDDTVSATTPYKVVGVYEGSPAYEAGIRPDDIIVQIDGKTIEGMKYQDVYNDLLLGKPLTAVAITIQRGTQMETFTMMRGRAASGLRK